MPAPMRRLQEIPPYVFITLAAKRQARKAAGGSVLDLSLGSPDQPTPPAIIEALAEAARDTTRHGYPHFRGEPAYLEHFADFHARRFGVTLDPSTNLVPTAGAKEALAQICRAYCDIGDVVLLADVAYPVYYRAVMASGAEVVDMPVTAEGEWWPDFAAIPVENARRAKLMILNFPGNPTGGVTTREKWAEAVAYCRAHDILLVSDLAYSELVHSGPPAPSVFEVEGAMDVALEVHSCSKNFSMAGLRIGMVVCSPDVCNILNEVRNLTGYGAPTAIQRAAAYAYEHAESCSAIIRAGYRERFDAAVAGFASGGLTVVPPVAGMYLWLPVPEGRTDWEVTDALLEQEGILLTPGSGFGVGGRGYLRISMVAPPTVLKSACRHAASAWSQASVG